MVTDTDSISHLYDLTAQLSDQDEELIAERNRYKVISDVVIAANRAQTHTDLFNDVLPILCKAFDFDGSAAYLIHPESGIAILKSHYNFPDESIEKYDRINIMEEPYRDTLTEGHLIVFSGSSANIYGTKLLVLTPIVSSCGVIGGLAFFSDEHLDLGSTARTLLPTIGKHLGDTLRRIWAEKLLKSEMERYKSLSEQHDELICENSAKSQELQAINDELHRANNNLLLTADTLVNIIDAIPLPIWWKTLDGVYLGANARFCDIVGLPRHEVMGKTLHEIFPALYWDEYDIGDETALECRHAEYIGEYHSKEDNKEHRGRFVKNVVYNSNHDPFALICIVYPCEESCNEVEYGTR